MVSASSGQQASTAMGNGRRARLESVSVTAIPLSVAPPTRPPLRRVPRREKGLQLPLIPDDELPAGVGGDRVPEQTHYRDEGCEFWHACLSCPFSRCILEIPGGPKRILRLLRNAEARRLFDAGTPIGEIAAELGIARRTVYTALGSSRRRGRANDESRAANRGAGRQRRSVHMQAGD
jgi:DNA-binding CsgD family transcriptional regulator